MPEETRRAMWFIVQAARRRKRLPNKNRDGQAGLTGPLRSKTALMRNGEFLTFAKQFRTVEF